MTGLGTIERANLHVLPPLPYPEDALDPAISAKTIGFHYGKHHKGYVDTLNKLLAGTELASLSLGNSSPRPRANSTRLRSSTMPRRRGTTRSTGAVCDRRAAVTPPTALKQRIEASFGTVDACKKELAAAATTQFGSGWAWLVLDADKLKVVKTANAETPLTAGARPLVVIDVWEHSYCLDYQDRRADYASAVLDKLIDWGFAADILG